MIIDQFWYFAFGSLCIISLIANLSTLIYVLRIYESIEKFGSIEAIEPSFVEEI